MSPAGAGFVYLWRYDVRPEHEVDFERLYGPGGDWARFFGRSPAYLGTDLLRGSAGEYVTIDRWTDRAAHAAFIAGRRAEWDALDARGERLTTAERPIGEFDVVR